MDPCKPIRGNAEEIPLGRVEISFLFFRLLRWIGQLVIKPLGGLVCSQSQHKCRLRHIPDDMVETDRSLPGKVIREFPGWDFKEFLYRLTQVRFALDDIGMEEAIFDQRPDQCL